MGVGRCWVVCVCGIDCVVVSLFLQDPKREFNRKIDAPVEREEELYGKTKAREREELLVARA